MATKFRFMMGSGPNKSGGSRYEIMRCAEESLKRLKTDRIDLAFELGYPYNFMGNVQGRW